VGIFLDEIKGSIDITLRHFHISTELFLRSSHACGAEILRWIRTRLQAFGDDTDSIKSFGLDVITDLCDQLRNAGVPGIHFYSMNQAATVTEICKRLDLTA
jgi:methylenetetrahydrofolate reductase (NADPH)